MLLGIRNLAIRRQGVLFNASALCSRGKHTKAKAKQRGKIKVGEEDGVTDLRAPHFWYPSARRVKRRIICHAGPTNSGKTHAALEALRDAACGVYCGPLRLLAWEVHERLNASGVPCNLLTGQEKTEVDGAAHTSSTVEMTDLNDLYDVAVVDEAQMLGDASRGWAWTRAVLGLAAAELHLCGSPAFVPLAKRLAEEMGDEFEVIEYERLSPLRASRRALGNLSGLLPGDCVVAFSRRHLHRLKHDVEVASGGSTRCCIVYGGLPPEARREQARLFNDKASDYDVLVASDAIGMGLNLSISRVIFAHLEKFDGRRRRELHPHEIKQIAGRAGRFGGPFSKGIVTCVRQSDMALLHESMAAPEEELEFAGLFPTLQQLEEFGKAMGGYDSSEPRRKGAGSFRRLRLSDVIQAFVNNARVAGSPYFMCDVTEVKEIADLLEPVAMPMRDRYTFLLAPVDTSDPEVMTWLRWYARSHARGQAVRVGLDIGSVGEASEKNWPLGAAGGDSEVEVEAEDFENDSNFESDSDSDGGYDYDSDNSDEESEDESGGGGSDSRHSDDGARDAIAATKKTYGSEGDSIGIGSGSGSGPPSGSGGRRPHLDVLPAAATPAGLAAAAAVASAAAAPADETAAAAAAAAAAASAVAAAAAWEDALGWKVPTTVEQLQELETRHRVLDLYVWLGQRFSTRFPDLPQARLAAGACSRLIEKGLRRLRPSREAMRRGGDGNGSGSGSGNGGDNGGAGGRSRRRRQPIRQNNRRSSRGGARLKQ